VNRTLCQARIIFPLILLALTSVAQADEGMWLLNRTPKELLKQKYNFEPSPAWLEHMQKSSARFGRRRFIVNRIS